MSNICIDVEFLAGTCIHKAIEEAKEKAIKWDVAYVKFDFNGKKFSIGKACEVQSAVDAWDSSCSGDSDAGKYGFVFS